MAFLPGSVNEDVQVIIEQTVDPSDGAGFQVAGQVFQITARTMSGTPITTFDPPFLLTVKYDDLPLGADIDPFLYYWRESDGIWVKVPATHNPTARTLTAVLDHLTTFAVMQRERYPVYIPMLVR